MLGEEQKSFKNKIRTKAIGAEYFVQGSRVKLISEFRSPDYRKRSRS